MRSRSVQLNPRSSRFVAVYREHQKFVWQSLCCLGVPHDQIDDAMQDVFLVVHRRLPEFEGRAKMRTWVFEILRRVASRYRTRIARDRARFAELPELVASDDLHRELDHSRAAELIQGFLAGLDNDRLAVFMLAEFGGLRGREIAEELGVNINTVYARLRATHRKLDQLALRVRAKDSREAIDTLRRRRPSARSGSRVLAAVLGHAGRVTTAGATSAGTWAVVKVYALGATGSAALLAAIVAVAPNEPSAPKAPVSASVAPKGQNRAPVAERQEPSAVPMQRAVDAGVAAASRAPTQTQPPRSGRPRAARSKAEESGPPLAEEAASASRLQSLVGRARVFERAVTRHRARFPSGALALEVEAMDVEHGCRVSAEGARARFAAFASAHPQSALVARAQAPCEASISVQKPQAAGTQPP